MLDLNFTTGNVPGWYDSVGVVGEFDNFVSLCDWVEVWCSDTVRTRSQSGSLDEAGCDVFEVGFFSGEQGFVWMAREVRLTKFAIRFGY